MDCRKAIVPRPNVLTLMTSSQEFCNKLKYGTFVAELDNKIYVHNVKNYKQTTKENVVETNVINQLTTFILP